MSNVQENSWSWIEYTVETINKLIHDVVNLVSTTFELTFEPTDSFIFDDLRQKLYECFNEFIALLAFDDFQLQLLKIFLFIFVSTVALIFIAWHIYGPRISEQFMEPSPTDKQIFNSNRNLAYVIDQFSTTSSKMAEKIKSFFRKAKKDAKFMNAGKGHKLTDSTTTVQSTSVVEQIKRVEPTQEARVAGKAALARLEAKESNAKRFNTSYATIKAQVKRELEEEKRAQQEAEESHTQLVKETDSTVTDNSHLAVSNICYRCPYLSNEVLSQDEWKIKIREFLYEQMNGDEAGLTACLVIRNCNPKEEKIEACIETIAKYLENIVNHPDEDKYKKIRMQNRIFQDKVLPIEGALQFLNAAGFRQERLMNNDKEEDFLIWSADNCSTEDVIMLIEALKTAERIPLELDRNLQVLLPTQASKRTELPSDFFKITPQEIKREQQQRTETVQMNQMLRTKAMRERDEQRHRKYKFSLIRIKFPDNLVLQGTFSIHDNFQTVVNFVSENLINNERPFSLIKLPNIKFNEDSYDESLLKLGLFPTALLMFVWKSESQETNCSESVGYLKEELLSIIQPV